MTLTAVAPMWKTTHKTPLCYICKVDRNTPNCTPISPQFSHHLKSWKCHLPINGLPSYQLDEDREKVVFKTKDGSKVVNKDYHHGNSFVYGKRHDLEGYFFIIEESDLQ